MHETPNRIVLMRAQLFVAFDLTNSEKCTFFSLFGNRSATQGVVGGRPRTCGLEASDSIASAIAVTCNSATRGTNLGMTVSDRAPSCGLKGVTADVWYYSQGCLCLVVAPNPSRPKPQTF